MNQIERAFVDTATRQRDHVPAPNPLAVISGDAILVDASTGQPVAAQLTIPAAETEAYRHALAGVKFGAFGRMSGLNHMNDTFGFRPRQPIRKRDSCQAAAFNSAYPAAYQQLEHVARLAAEAMAATLPDAHARQAAIADTILPDWRVAAGLWTSGVINHTAALDYHRDLNNVHGSWSAMLVLRRYVRGGLLSIPDYGVAFACHDNALLIFSGAELIHGVTPFSRVTSPAGERGYRLTTVFYAAAGLAGCLCPDDEIARGQAARTAREDGMLT